MKITCQRDKLLHSFQTAATVVSSRSPKPILKNVKLSVEGDQATLLATDLEVGVRMDLAGVTVERPGAAVLPVAQFGMILRESSDDELSIDGELQGITVRGQRSEFRLPAMDPAEFPEVPEFHAEKYVEVPARLLRQLIHRTIFAADTENARYALSGVLLEIQETKITAVGTDGRRLAKMEGPSKLAGGYLPGEQMTIVPARAMSLIDRTLSDADGDVRMAIHANDILVRTGRATIFARLVEGRFPRWRDVLPNRSDAAKISLTVGPFYAALRQASVATNEDARGIDLRFADGTAVLCASAADVGQSRVELPIAYDGPEVQITLDYRFLGDFLRVLEPEKTFTLDVKDADQAALCSTDDGYGYVVMPLSRDR